MTLAPGQRLGPYEITAKLGEGGMGEVYRATDTVLKREVAIKVLPAAFIADPERLARFEREAQLLAQLHHPNIASIFGLEQSGGGRALVLELVEGPTLAERIRSGPLPVEECLLIARQVAEALEEAHDKGIVHRDLKPQNIKAADDGKVKVLDFGLAKALDPLSGAPASASQLAQSPTLTFGATVQGVILGTAAYMAPEQAKGLPVDKRADIWAFGVVLFEMLTGARLFGGETVPETLADVLKGEIDFAALPAETPPHVRDLLRRCLERNPKLRLRDIGEARLLLASGPLERSAVEPAATPWARRRLVVAAAAAAVLAFVAGWLVSARLSPPAAPAQPMHLQLVAAPDDGTVGLLALSPDGETLAFTAWNTLGTSRLFTRSLADGVEHAVAGTEGADSFFWSADGRELGFFADGALFRVPAQGGPRQRICAAPLGTGGTWNRDGVILFGTWTGKPIQRVPATGGEPQPATTLDAGREESGHLWPSFLPDGRHFLYLGDSEVDAGHTVRIGDLAGGSSKIVLEGVFSSVLYARDHLIYVRDGALVVQPFDLARLETIGGARPVAARVAWFDRHAWGFTAEGERLLWVDRDRHSHLRWLDRAGRVLGEVPTDADDVHVALSPDGRRVAVERVNENRRDGKVWILDLDRGTSSPLRVATDFQADPLWSPDGKSLAVLLETPELPLGAYRQALDRAGKPEKLALGGSPQGFSPDGRWLALEVSPEGSPGADIAIDDLQSGKRLKFAATSAWEHLAQFSPDGRFVAYFADSDVYVEPFPQTGERWQISSAGGSIPKWSPKGDELFYLAADESLMTVPVTLHPTFSAGVPRPLFRAPWKGFQNRVPYAVAPDAQRFLTLLEERNPSTIEVSIGWAAQR